METPEPARAASLWAPVVAYMAFIFGLSSIAQPPGLPAGLSDKTGHVALYFGLSALLVRAFAGGWRARVTPFVACLAAVAATAYGVSDEFHQLFVPPRQADALDLAADAVGAALAALAGYALSRFRL